MPIGIYEEKDRPFSKHNIHTVDGDMIYMFSDGYSDQFGGPDHKKFSSSSFKLLLTAICDQPLEAQRKRVETEFYRWKGNEPQTDDVLIIGLRI